MICCLSEGGFRRGSHYHFSPEEEHSRVVDDQCDDAQQNESDDDLAGAGRRTLEMDHDTHGGREMLDVLDTDSPL